METIHLPVEKREWTLSKNVQIWLIISHLTADNGTVKTSFSCCAVKWMCKQMELDGDCWALKSFSHIANMSHANVYREIF